MVTTMTMRGATKTCWETCFGHSCGVNLILAQVVVVVIPATGVVVIVAVSSIVDAVVVTVVPQADFLPLAVVDADGDVSLLFIPLINHFLLHIMSYTSSLS
jgi:hypothetical protein